MDVERTLQLAPAGLTAGGGLFIPKEPMMAWSAEEIILLKECIDTKLSASKTSARFEGKYSRCACIGMARRLGIKFMSQPQGGPRQFNLPFRKKRERQPPKPPVEVIEISSNPCTFDEIKAGICRWPLWATNTPLEEQRYCGDQALCGPYCLKHFSIAYRPGRSRSRREPSPSFTTWNVPLNA